MSSDRKELRIFVVDDESVIALTLAMILSKKGFEAHAFTLPLEALERAHEIPPNLLISDVVMPLLSGIELAIRIRELCPSCKVLLFPVRPPLSICLRRPMQADTILRCSPSRCTRQTCSRRSKPYSLTESGYGARFDGCPGCW